VRIVQPQKGIGLTRLVNATETISLLSFLSSPLITNSTSPFARAVQPPTITMSVPRSFPPSSFPSFHLHPFPHSSLPTKLDELTTKEIALSWILYDNLDTATWRKLLRIWRARREKERGSIEADSDPVFELLAMDWQLPEQSQFDQLDSAQLAVSLHASRPTRSLVLGS